MLPGGVFFSTAAQRFGRPDKFTLLALFKTAAKARSLRRAAQLHALCLKLGFSSYTVLQNRLLKCYCACGRVDIARHLFDGMPRRDVVSFNTLLHGYTTALDLKSAARLFAEAPERNLVSWTTMVVGFSAAGDVSAARNLFDGMPADRDVIAWNAMISAYAQNHRPLEALGLFVELLGGGGPEPNQTTLAGVLSACAAAGALDAGRWVHVFLRKQGFRLDPFLGSALVDMYSKCGVPESAMQVFESLREKNVCTWNAAINGLAMNGMADGALELFRRMRLVEGLTPDAVTFVGVLRACSHGGFVEEGRRHFYFTMAEYGVRAVLEHYACMVDLLARRGRLKEAEQLIMAMPVSPDAVVWRALLGGCRLHRDVAVAERAVAAIAAAAASTSGDYVLLSNLYAAVGLWGEAARIRTAMSKTGLKKTPGCSSIEIGGAVHEFLSGDRYHPRYEEIAGELAALGRRMSAAGYRPQTAAALYDVEEEEKGEALGHHSEKLALGLGLLCTADGTTLRIVKNLRFCGDCHAVFKLASELCRREIVVRDRVRFHHFSHGLCSCGDYW